MTTRIEDVSHIAVGNNGDLVFVGTDRGDMLAIYDFSTRDALSTLNNVALDGALIDMAAAGDYVLALVEIDGDGDQIEVVGPDPYRGGDYGVVAAVDIPDGPRRVFISPDHSWALVVGDGWSTVLQLVSSVESVAFGIDVDGSPLSGAAAVGMVLVGSENPNTIQQYLLRGDRPPRASRSFTVDAPPKSISLNARMSLGAAVVGDSIVFFDPAVMETVGRPLQIDGTPVSAQFLAREEGEWLVVALENSRDLMLYEATDPASLSALGSLPLGINAGKFVLYDDLIFAADGRQLSIFRLN
ncbi:MAG: hypothetical protein IT320_25790 [Anaerolineae bacterium]|nr:hypothetical protein [Anaerolineae bacterium]